MRINNSIYKCLDKASIQNTIRLILSSPKHKIIVITEGIEDIQLLVSLFNMDEVAIFESYSGKEGVKEIVGAFDDGSEILGIVDKDYESISSVRNVFYYDYCNAEMMLIGDDKFYEHIIFKSTLKSFNFIELRNKVLSDLLEFSAIRKLNEENHWGINLCKVPVVLAIRNSNGDVLQSLILHINRKNLENPINLSDDRGMMIREEIYKLRFVNSLEYVNGHDFLKLLCDKIKELFSSDKNLLKRNGDDYGHDLRIGYNINYFKKTQLYNALTEYEKDTGTHILVSLP